MTRAALTATSANSRSSATASATPPRWMFERNSPRAGGAAHGGDHVIAHHERADILAARLGDELLQEDLLAQRPERVEHPLHLGGGVGDHHPDALRPLDELDDAGQTTDHLDGLGDLLAVAAHHGARDVDPEAREELPRAACRASGRWGWRC